MNKELGRWGRCRCAPQTSLLHAAWYRCPLCPVPLWRRCPACSVLLWRRCRPCSLLLWRHCPACSVLLWRRWVPCAVLLRPCGSGRLERGRRRGSLCASLFDQLRSLHAGHVQEEIYSSSYAAAAYLEAIDFPKDKKVYVVGEVGIQVRLAGWLAGCWQCVCSGAPRRCGALAEMGCRMDVEVCCVGEVASWLRLSAGGMARLPDQTSLRFPQPKGMHALAAPLSPPAQSAEEYSPLCFHLRRRSWT